MTDEDRVIREMAGSEFAQFVDGLKDKTIEQPKAPSPFGDFGAWFANLLDSFRP